jgi:toxin CcdB
MARFDVYRNPVKTERKIVPYFLDVQNTFLADSSSRVVIPLRADGAAYPPVQDLNPSMLVDGIKVSLDTCQMGAVPLQALGAKVSNVASEHLTIALALDKLLGGY